MGVRSSNTTLKDEDDDYAHQIVIGDLERLSMDASVNAAAIAENAANILANATSVASQFAALGGDGLIGDYSTLTAYTSGSGTHTFTAGKSRFIAVLVGGGGGGALGIGTFGNSGSSGGGAGGGGGSVIVIGAIATASASYVVGAGGAEDTGSGAVAGEVTTLTHNSATLTAPGGLRAFGGRGGEGGRPIESFGSAPLIDALFQGVSTIGIPIPGSAGESTAMQTIVFTLGVFSNFGGAATTGGRALFSSGAVGLGGTGGRGGSNAAGAGGAGIVVFYEK